MQFVKLIASTTVLMGSMGMAHAEAINADEMRSLTTGVLAGITGEVAPEAEPAEPEALESLVKQALSEGQSDAYLDALINEAADGGQIEVPSELRTTDGSVDTEVLLASLVDKSLGEDTVKAAAADAAVEEDRFHVVKSGDSLARIAITYYDSALDYPVIFSANRDILSSPDRIRVGQTLRIPAQ